MLLHEFLQEHQIKEICYSHEVFDYFLYLLKRNIDLKKAIQLSLKESYGIKLDILDFLSKKLEEAPIEKVEKLQECIDMVYKACTVRPIKSNIMQLIYLTTAGEAVIKGKDFSALCEANFNMLYNRKAG